MSADPVLFEKRDGFVVVTLNRPDRLNAFTDGIHDGLRAAFDRIETDDEIRAVVITGAGRGFCAGQDLGERDLTGDARPDLGQSLEDNYNPIIRRMRALPKPIVVAVNGVAAGRGARIFALSGDIVLAARSAKSSRPLRRSPSSRMPEGPGG